MVFMFPGQGAQFAGMGADLYEQEIVFRDVVDRCAELLRPSLQEDLRHILFPTAEQERRCERKDSANPIHTTGPVCYRVCVGDVVDELGSQAVGDDRSQRRRVRRGMSRWRAEAWRMHFS